MSPPAERDADDALADHSRRCAPPCPPAPQFCSPDGAVSTQELLAPGRGRRTARPGPAATARSRELVRGAERGTSGSPPRSLLAYLRSEAEREAGASDGHALESRA